MVSHWQYLDSELEKIEIPSEDNLELTTQPNFNFKVELSPELVVEIFVLLPYERAMDFLLCLCIGASCQ